MVVARITLRVPNVLDVVQAAWGTFPGVVTTLFLWLLMIQDVNCVWTTKTVIHETRIAALEAIVSVSASQLKRAKY
jgi:hypothetical protein